MAKIEIDLVEYNELKTEIKTLQSKVAELKKENNDKLGTISRLIGNIKEIKSLSLFNRIFNFKETIDLYI